jgi:hypothetical protein
MTSTVVYLVARFNRATDARGEIQVYLNTSNYDPHSLPRYDGLGYKVSKKP